MLVFRFPVFCSSLTLLTWFGSRMYSSCLNCTELTFLPPLPVSMNTLSLSHIPMKSIPKGTIPTTLRFLYV
jgi:hypothetical protein